MIENGSADLRSIRHVWTYLIPDAAVEEEILSDLESSNKQDSEDCAKRLICELYGSSETLAWDERLIKNYIQPKLDYASPIIQFQLAADLGRRQVSACVTVYSRLITKLIKWFVN